MRILRLGYFFPKLKPTTMKFFFLLFFLILYFNFANGQITSVEWAHSFGSSSNDSGHSVCTDSFGNIIVVGGFSGVVDFDPGTGIVNQGTAGGHGIFIQKLDSDGNLIWVKSILGTGVSSLETDAFGNLYITGSFNNTVDFDPGPNNLTLTPTGGSSDTYILKLDAGGNLTWVKQVGGNYRETPRDIQVDASGNVYIIGALYGAGDFDPGPGVFYLSANTTYYQNIFLVKLNSNGNFMWARAITGYNPIYAGEIAVDQQQNLYVTGKFRGADFDPSSSSFHLMSEGWGDGFLLKLDVNGDFLWVKQIGGQGSEGTDAVTVDKSGNIILSGTFQQTTDLDLSPNDTLNVTAIGIDNAYVLKLRPNGDFVWAKPLVGTGNLYPIDIKTDYDNNIYLTGLSTGTMNYGGANGLYNVTSTGKSDATAIKLDTEGNLIWAQTFGSSNYDRSLGIDIDNNSNVFLTGFHKGLFYLEADDPAATLTPSGGKDIFVIKLNQKKIYGRVFQDFNQSCIQDNNELGLANRMAKLSNGTIVTTNGVGVWAIDSLPIGTYNITFDTSGGWQATCPINQSFAVPSLDSFVEAPHFGLYSNNPCPSPDVSIHAPFLRPGFSNQNVFLRVCNLATATGPMDSTFVTVELDSLLTIQSASHNFIPLGNNQYRIDVDSIFPNFCEQINLSCHLSSNAIIGQSLCMSAELYTVDSCYLNLGQLPFSNINCQTTYDFSHLVVRPICDNDSLSFVIYNTGDGDMSCMSQVRIYNDGSMFLIDSIQLLSGDSAYYAFAADGSTWHLEVDQHPLHPGLSLPSATIELCGGVSSWTPNLFNVLPQNDYAQTLDIYCGEVRGSYDPNIKTGYPLGVGHDNYISPNQDIEYLIQFQNTGTDTAFTVIIRDTLSSNLDVFSVRSGASSHDYDFRIYDSRVLEWTFNNIMLPDSNINEAQSHGFVKFKVNQQADLVEGTVINNHAAIYFDYNQAIITNSYSHTIKKPVLTILPDTTDIDIGNIHVYPNPTTGWLSIEKESSESLNLIILDNLGRVLLTQKLIEDTDINLNMFPSGLYFLHFNSGTRAVTRKVLKL